MPLAAVLEFDHDAEFHRGGAPCFPWQGLQNGKPTRRGERGCPGGGGQILRRRGEGVDLEILALDDCRIPTRNPFRWWWRRPAPHLLMVTARQVAPALSRRSPLSVQTQRRNAATRSGDVESTGLATSDGTERRPRCPIRSSRRRACRVPFAQQLWRWARQPLRTPGHGWHFTAARGWLMAIVSTFAARRAMPGDVEAP